MRDPYEVLGVQRSAKPAAIKSAYRRLAKKLHPDANPNDPKAAERFAELNSAYEIVGDEAKRKAFDAAKSTPRASRCIRLRRVRRSARGRFRARRLRSRPSPGDPAALSAAAAAGLANPLGSRMCSRKCLGGPGAGRGISAGATHRFPISSLRISGPAQRSRRGGRGDDCTHRSCKGYSRRVTLPTGKEVDVKIPAGLADGQQIRLKGQGLPGAGAPGDALITVHIAEDPRFKRDGADLRLDLPITLYEAVLGGQVRVPTLDGAVSLTIPPAPAAVACFGCAARACRKIGRGRPARDRAHRAA